MTTAVLEGVDTEVTDKVDLATPKKCDNSKCDKVAKWRITLKCCAGIILLCNDHMDQLLEGIAEGSRFRHQPPSGCGSVMIQPIASAERI